MYSTLISAPQLQALLGSGQPCMIFDCSFELMQPSAGTQQYQQAHIAGAVRADLDLHLSASKAASDAASGGRHPLPSRQSFAAWLSSVGFGNSMQAVVYDRQGGAYCARLWWMLKWAGHEAVAVLDGGWQAWQASATGPGASAAHAPATPSSPLASARASFALGPPLATLITTPTIVSQLGRPSQHLIDARATPRFKGEVEPLDPVAGHIPGALNRPFGLNLDLEGKFKPAAALRCEFEALLGGRDPAAVVHHCGSGVSAVPNLLAMELAGLGRSALYAGSWSEWCSDPQRPVARG